MVSMSLLTTFTEHGKSKSIFMTKVQIAHNAVVAKLISPTKDVIILVNNMLAYTAENGFGGGSWSGKSSFYRITTNSFPAGFVYLVQQELIGRGYEVQIIAEQRPVPLGPDLPIVDAFGHGDSRYDYQIKAMRQVEKFGAGIIQVATGGGKSRICKLIVSRYKRKTLFLTTRGVLLYQMDDQFKELGFVTGQIGDGEFSPVEGINLGMVQTFAQALKNTTVEEERRNLISSNYRSKDVSRQTAALGDIAKAAQEIWDRKQARRNKLIAFLESIEVVIGEEAHEAGGTSYFEILQYCKKARIRVALTATPFMRENAEDNMRLMAAFGPILISISEKTLIDHGILAKPYFKYADCPPGKGLTKYSPFERAYTLGYVENDEMLKIMRQDAFRARKLRVPVLTLIARKKHGERLMKAYNAAGIRTEFLKGEDDQDERKRQLKRLVKGELDCVVGTTILDVGVDVPAIGLVQLGGGMKAEVSLRQRIGRGLRAKKSGANITFIVDYTCDVNSKLREHRMQRQSIVKSTPGFAEGIIAEGQDLPWSLFER